MSSHKPIPLRHVRIGMWEKSGIKQAGLEFWTPSSHFSLSHNALSSLFLDALSAASLHLLHLCVSSLKTALLNVFCLSHFSSITLLWLFGKPLCSSNTLSLRLVEFSMCRVAPVHLSVHSLTSQHASVQRVGRGAALCITHSVNTTDPCVCIYRRKRYTGSDSGFIRASPLCY